MADVDWDNDNPFAPPGSFSHEFQQSDAADEEALVIKPSIRPRDPLDIIMGLTQVAEFVLLFLAATAAFGVAFGAAFLVVSWWVSEEGALVILAILFGVLLLSCIFLIAWVSQYQVSRLLIGVNGVEFQNASRAIRSLAWDRIHSIRPATRGEVFIQGWLWPPFPSKEPTKTLSTCGHFRIEWDQDYCFFPPKDPALFEQTIMRFHPELLQSE